MDICYKKIRANLYRLSTLAYKFDIMAVVCQGFNVIIKVDTLNQKYPWWVEWYRLNVPNKTFCSDWKLTRVGFMRSQDVGTWIEYLESNWLIFAPNDEAIDICVVDETEWPTTKCVWIDQYLIKDEFSYVCLAEEEDNNVIFPEWFIKGFMERATKEESDKYDLMGIDGSTEEYSFEWESKYVWVPFDYSLQEWKEKTTKILKSYLKNKKKN